MQTKRNYGIDVIKGVCILLVVLCHTVQFEKLPEVFATIAAAIFLKLFFMVSGYLAYKPKTDDKYAHLKRIRKRFKSLIIPYIVFSIGTILWHIIICVGFDNRYVSDSYTGWDVVKRDIFVTVSGMGIGTLWFLPVLFFTFAILELLVSALTWIKKSSMRHGMLIILSMFLIYLSVIFYNIQLDGGSLVEEIIGKYTHMLYRICYGTGYSLVGYVIRKLWIFLKDKQKKYLILTLFEITLLSIMVVTYFIPENYGVFDFTSSIFIMIFILALFETNLQDVLCKITKPLIFCGQNSLSITIYHYLLFYPIERIVIDGWILFFVNTITTVVLVLLVHNQIWHKKIMGMS